MLKKYTYIIFAIFLVINQSHAQIKPNSGTDGRNASGVNSEDGPELGKKKKAQENKPKIPSHIKTWEIREIGSVIKKTELDTTLNFYQVYHPIFQNSISNTFIGNIGGANISNDFFKRTYNSDFLFTRSFDAYWLTPSQIRYFNTTTPYSTLEYSQSESRVTKNETRFNVFLSQNVNKKFSYEFIYNQTKSQGQFSNQLNKFHNLALATSYISNKFLSHSNIIFNRLQDQENGGLAADQTFSNALATDNYIVQMRDALKKLQNNNIYTVNEYRLGKTIPADTANKVKEKFIPRVGFIHQIEFSNNKHRFTKTDPTLFFKNIYQDSTQTADSTKYTRLTNIFQIKFYEAPDRKYTFGKRAYIGNDQLWYNFSKATGYYPQRQSNTFVGGGIFRNEGKFWQWEADGRIYLTGYRAGQTELNGFLNKPLKIGRDTTSLRIEGCLKSIVPDYYDRYFYSNHFQWSNNFNNTNEMTIRSSINSHELKTTIGVNYSLIDNYIYNDEDALPAQASGELLILAAYLNKEIERDHWIIRAQALVQKANNENLIHIPAFAGFISFNYRTIISKVMHFQIGADTRYNSAFYADAYEPATSRFYLQHSTLIGKYPYIDLHVNMKLKRTRFFFTLMNAASGFAGNNYFMSPDYPYLRRTYRIGLSWSFYD